MRVWGRRPWITHTTLGLLAGVGLSWSGARPARAQATKPRLRLAVGGKAAMCYLPLTLAERLGFFAQEGVSVQVIDHRNAADAMRAALQGEADVVSGAYEHTLDLAARGVAYRSFVLQGRAPQIALGVSTVALPQYRQVADLKGRRLGVSALGASTHLVASQVLSRAGVMPRDVSFVPVGTGWDALEALRLGRIDALSNIDPVMTLLEKSADVRIVADTRSVKGALALFGGAMPGGCLYASEAFVGREADTCQALANAIVHALKWLQTAGPSDLIRAVPEGHMLGDRGLFLDAFLRNRDALSVDGLMPNGGPETALRVLSEHHERVRGARIDLSRTYTDDMAVRAKQRFKA